MSDFGSLEWAKQIVTDANAGVLAMTDRRPDIHCSGCGRYMHSAHPRDPFPLVSLCHQCKTAERSEPTGSPSLMEHVPRTRERAALDIATAALRKIHRITSNDPAPGSDDEKDIEQIEAIAGLALDRVTELVRPHDIHGEPERNTDRRP